MSSIKSFFQNLKYNTEGKVALASIIINIALIVTLGGIMTTGDVPGYTPRAELEAKATECTLEHIDPNATTTTTTTTTVEEDEASTTSGNNNTTTKNNGSSKKTTTTKKATTTTKKNLDNDGEWVDGWY